MEKLHLENKIEISKIIRNRKATKVALIVILVLTLAMATGCGKKKNKTPTPTTPSATVTKEETTPEVVEPTESTPVETVEPTETVPETEVVEKEPETFDELVEYLNNSDFSGLKIIALYKDNSARLLEEGEEFVVQNGDCAPVLYYSEKAEEIKASSSYFSFFELNDNCSMIIFGTEDCEGTITVTTVDGNVYETTNSYRLADAE